MNCFGIDFLMIWLRVSLPANLYPGFNFLFGFFEASGFGIVGGSGFAVAGFFIAGFCCVNFGSGFAVAGFAAGLGIVGFAVGSGIVGFATGLGIVGLGVLGFGGVISSIVEFVTSFSGIILYRF